MTKVAVTGASSYTGRFIAERLLSEDANVIDLTRRTGTTAAAQGGMTPVLFPGSPVDELARALEGIDTIYNTHWIRFERREATYARALDAIELLLDAAAAAGVRRFVHVSVVHAAHDAPTKYFRAKARAEDFVRASGISHAIVRPTVTFGPDDILVNNLAWTLRRLPVFGIPGNGRYPIQPVHVADIARIAIEAGARSEDVVLDAAGPERFEFIEFVRVVRSAVGSRARILRIPVPVALAAARVIGAVVNDVVLRRDEVTELEARLMASDVAPLGRIRFADWVGEHAAELGRHWSSELDRHYRVPAADDPLPRRRSR